MQRDQPPPPPERSQHRPTPELLEEVVGRLRHHYDFNLLGNQQDPLDELIYIVLSGRTRDSVFRALFAQLRSRFESWDEIRLAHQGEVANILQPAGLSAKKSEWLVRLLHTISILEGQASLTRLSQLPTEKAEEYLIHLPGVGIKTARCVLMYSLGRPVFPVDAHCRRLLERLGAIPRGVHYSKIHDLAQQAVPQPLRFELHVYALMHGRALCLPRNPRCQTCPLLELCPHGRAREA